MDLLRPMAHIHSNYPVNGKKKALLVAVKDVNGFCKLYRAQRDAKELRRLLIGIFDLFLPHAS